MRLILIVAVVTAVVLGVIYKRVSSKRMELLRLQQACLRYDRPAEQVVYEEDPARAADLLKSGGEHVAIPADSAGGPPIAGHVPGICLAMRRWAMRAEADEIRGAVLFLQERQTAAGNRGLVCVEADRAARRLRVTFIHPGASTLDPAPVTEVAVIPRPEEGLVQLTSAGDPFDSRLPPESEPPTTRADLRFFAGQADPQEPSHFTLPYERNGRRGELDLWVQDDKTVLYTNRQFAGR